VRNFMIAAVAKHSNRSWHDTVVFPLQLKCEMKCYSCSLEI